MAFAAFIIAFQKEWNTMTIYHLKSKSLRRKAGGSAAADPCFFMMLNAYGVQYEHTCSQSLMWQQMVLLIQQKK